MSLCAPLGLRVLTQCCSILRLLSSGYSIVNFTVIASLLFRDLSVDYAAKSVENIATYYQLTSDIPFPFFDIIFGTQVILACYLIGRLIKWRLLLDILTAVFYFVVMLLYIFLELPAIQLFAVHRKRSEANFIRRYHLVMFVLTLFCVTFQVLVHSSHRYGSLYIHKPPAPFESSHEQQTKRQRSAERLHGDHKQLVVVSSPATAAAPGLASTMATKSSPAPSPSHSPAPVPAPAPAPRHLSAAARGMSTPLLKRSGGT